jgi:hypothetical protein
MFKGQVSVITVAACFQYITFCVDCFVNRAVLSTPKVWNELVRVAQKVCYSANRFCWRTQALLIEIALPAYTEHRATYYQAPGLRRP